MVASEGKWRSGRQLPGHLLCPLRHPPMADDQKPASVLTVPLLPSMMMVSRQCVLTQAPFASTDRCWMKRFDGTGKVRFDPLLLSELLLLHHTSWSGGFDVTEKSASINCFRLIGFSTTGLCHICDTRKARRADKSIGFRRKPSNPAPKHLS